MKQGVLIAFGEFFLKSRRVKNLFRLKLKNNLIYFLKREKVKFIFHLLHERFFVETIEPEKTLNILKNVFGVTWLAKVYFFENFEECVNFIDKNYKEWIKEDETFALRFSKGGDIQESSLEILKKVTQIIKRKIALTNPHKQIFLEHRKSGWFLYFEKEKGSQGLPVGTSSKVLTLISGGIDSPVASYLILKRGAENIWLHFHSYPLASKVSVEKVKKLGHFFLKYQPKLKIYFIPFVEIQKEFITKTSPKYRVLLYRRSMLRIAEKIAQREKCFALVTGESLGQVSSQTLVNLGIIEEVTALPVLRPLISMDKNEIIDLAKKISTYEISIEPQDDCCSLFVPSRITAEGKLEKVKAEERKVKITQLEEKALLNSEIIFLK